MKVPVLFENENFVVVDKPSGTLTTPSRFPAADERVCLGLELQRKLNLQLYPVHRLDFEVSGIVLFAKSPNAHRLSNHWFEARKIQKTYEALTLLQDFSHLPQSIKFPRQDLQIQKDKEFHWRCQILRGKKRSFESSAGKWSETIAVVSDIFASKQIYWSLNPLTGRPHQLRYELSRHGCPIIGDELYGSSQKFGDNGAIALRALRLDLSQIQDRLGLPEIIETTSYMRDISRF